MAEKETKEQKAERTFLYKRALEEAMKDGRISKEEQKILDKIKSDYSLYTDELDKALEDGTITPEEQERLEAVKERVSKDILKEIISDGVVSEDEAKMVKSIFDEKMNLLELDKKDKFCPTKKCVYLPPSYIVLLVVPERMYDEKIISTVENFTDKKGCYGVYVGLKYSANEIKELLIKQKVSVSKISFVDCKSGDLKNTEDTLYLSKSEFEEIPASIKHHLKNKQDKTLFFLIDSLESIREKITDDAMERFFNKLFQMMREYRVKGIVMCKKDKISESGLKKISKYIDQRIDL